MKKLLAGLIASSVFVLGIGCEPEATKTKDKTDKTHEATSPKTHEAPSAKTHETKATKEVKPDAPKPPSTPKQP